MATCNGIAKKNALIVIIVANGVMINIFLLFLRLCSINRERVNNMLMKLQFRIRWEFAKLLRKLGIA